MGVAIPPQFQWFQGRFWPQESQASPQPCWISKGVSQQNSHYTQERLHIPSNGTFEAMIFRFKKVGYIRSLEGIEKGFHVPDQDSASETNNSSRREQRMEAMQQMNSLFCFFIRPIEFLIEGQYLFLLLLGCFLHFSRQFVCVCIFETSIKKWSLVSSHKKTSWLDWFRIARWAEKTNEKMKSWWMTWRGSHFSDGYFMIPRKPRAVVFHLINHSQPHLLPTPVFGEVSPWNLQILTQRFAGFNLTKNACSKTWHPTNPVGTPSKNERIFPTKGQLEKESMQVFREYQKWALMDLKGEVLVFQNPFHPNLL